MRGVRVLEIDSSVASGYCTKLMASVGADAVCLEPVEGAAVRRHSPWIGQGASKRSARWEYLGAGKRSVVLGDDGVSEAELFGWADVVVSTLGADAEAMLRRHSRITAANPDAVHTVVSGFGLTGPWRDWRGSDLIDWASGGHLFLTGDPDREPLQGGGPWASYMVGATAAVGALAALLDESRRGPGQLVDVGAMETMAALHQNLFSMYTHVGAVKQRWGTPLGDPMHVLGLYRCEDEWISIVALMPQHWQALCTAMELWELLADPSLESLGERFERRAEIDAQIDAWVSQRSRQAVLAVLEAAGVPAGPMNAMSDVLADRHLEVQDFWDAPGHLDPAARMPARPFSLRAQRTQLAPAPTIGEHTSEVGAEIARGVVEAPRRRIDLGKVRVLEFATAWSGPLAARFLGDLGLDVVKIEHPSVRGSAAEVFVDEEWEWGKLPDSRIRVMNYPDARSGTNPWNRRGSFNEVNRSKRSLCLDAKPEAGADVLTRLIQSCDLIVNNFTPRGAKSLGIDPQRVADVNPHACTVSMSGYGPTGPLANSPSYGPVLQAFGGFDDATGYEDSGPKVLAVAFPDAVGGVHGAFAALATLWEREATGAGAHVELSQLETLLSIAGDMLLATSVTGEDPKRHGNRSEDCWPQGVYRCAGPDNWVAVTVQSDAEWQSLFALLADDSIADLGDAETDLRRADSTRIDRAISKWAGELDAEQAARRLQAAGVPASPAFTSAELFANPQLRDRGFFVSWDQPDVGVSVFPGFPIHFKYGETRITPSPTLGGHNGEVLQEFIGCSNDEVTKLFEAGVIADKPNW